MYSQRLFALTFALSTVFNLVEGVAEPLCRPHIAVKDAHFSQALNLKRSWTATIDVDASACAASSGLFALGFVRLSESAPDLEFLEPFIWRPAATKVRVEFWWDEAVDRYWVADIAACPCRSK